MTTGFVEGFVEIYNSFINQLPNWTQQFIGLFLLVILITIYAIFIWKFYRFIGTKNILGLNLNKYNTSKHPIFEKLFAGGFYLLEYLIILPFLIFFWFGIFSLFLIFLTEGLEIGTLLIISAGIIGAIRMTSYIPKYGQNLAKEIAKLLPFTLLAISITKPGFFDIQRIIGDLSRLPNLFSNIIIYLLFITLLEVILRIFDFIFSFFGVEDIPKIEEEE